VPDCICKEIGPFAAIANVVTLPMCRILANLGFFPNGILSLSASHKEFRIRHAIRSMDLTAPREKGAIKRFAQMKMSFESICARCCCLALKYESKWQRSVS
jgi:hypothetical protein